MLRESFNRGWITGPAPGMGAMMGGAPADRKEITLPYDLMLDEERSADSPNGGANAFYPAVARTVEKEFDVPAEWEDRLVIFEFEGVYMNASVFINGDYAGGFPHGYTNFYVEANRFLRYGEKNRISVSFHTSQDSRWYSGAGVYRDVKILVSELVHIVPDSFRVSAPEIDGEGAVAEISLAVGNAGHRTAPLLLKTAVLDAEGKEVISGETAVTAWPGERITARQRLYLENAHLWSVEDPYLYTVKACLVRDGRVLDEDCCRLGVRKLQLDPKHGLRINGKTVKLRGACVHHDNGLIGSAAIDRAEERRVEILKEAGFNAVRSAHNPISKAFLDACDRKGMLVMDEISDMWTRNKTATDYASSFPFFWEEQVERFIGKDFNHPSVILYSIGNEIPETGTPNGADWGRKLAEKIRSLDGSRYVMNSINTMLAVMDRLAAMMGGSQGAEINEAMTNLGEAMARLNDSELVTAATRESFDLLDVCGYNYATSRYELDKKLFPNRVLVGSETMPLQIAENWAVIQASPHAIGDFTWTGWDYIGEAGIGKMEYEEDGGPAGFMGAYPWYIAYCSDMDITGFRRPMSYYRQIVFGERRDPYIAVDYPWNCGKTLIHGMWETFSACSGWSWDGWEGKPVRVNVFGAGDSFRLLLNGREAGSGELKEFKGYADIPYEPGELTAVTLADGKETGRFTIRSAEGPVHLELKPDRTEIRADDTDLCYVEILLKAENGEVSHMTEKLIRAAITGCGELLALGTGNPKSTEKFSAGQFTSFDGRAMAVIRPCGAGEITLKVEAEGLEPVCATVRAE